MTQRQLNKLVKTWARKLGISDWYIRAEFKSSDEMPEDEGRCWHYPEYRRAIIDILQESDRDEESDSIESTVVHELLHIVLGGHKTTREGDYDEMFERGINLVTTALLEGRDE